MLVTPRRAPARRDRDDQGSALVSVLVMMLVLTLFALTVAAIVSNTSSGLASGKDTGQARAAADAGVAAGLAQFRKAEGCTGTLSSTTAPRYSVTCEATSDAVTFTSVGSADSGRSITVEAVFHYQTSHEYGSHGRELTFFSDTTYYNTDPVSSSTSDPADLTVIHGDFSCDERMEVNIVVDGDFYAGAGCTVTGNVTAFGNLRIDGTVDGNATGSGTFIAYGTVKGSVAAAGTGRSYVYGTVGGNLAAGGPVTVYYGDRVGGTLTSASTERTYLYGVVAGEVKLAGSLFLDYNGSIGGDTIAAGTSASYLYSKITGDFATGGNLTFDYNATVTGDVTVCGMNRTTIYGSIGGDLVTGGPVTIYYNANVGGAVRAAGTDRSYLYSVVSGDFAVAGSAYIDYNGVPKASVLASGTDQTSIYASVAVDVKAGGDVYLPANGRVRGNLSLPSGRTLSPNDASSRVDGTVRRAAAPTAPKAPTVSLPSSEVAVTGPNSSLLFPWQDYGFDSADWAGFTPVSLTSSNAICKNRDWATALSTYTTPTVIDATRCKGGIGNHPTGQTKVVISTDVVVVSTEIDLRQITVTAAPGTKPHLWFIVPSAKQAVRTDIPGLGRWDVGDGYIRLDSTLMNVPTMLYTPKTVSYYSGSFTGSMYATTLDVNGSTTTTIATGMDFPVALWGNSGGGSAGSFSVSPISQREIG
jgi:cytoskeletal protein CcmA (bactofilin family)